MFPLKNLARKELTLRGTQCGLNRMAAIVQMTF